MLEIQEIEAGNWAPGYINSKLFAPHSGHGVPLHSRQPTNFWMMSFGFTQDKKIGVAIDVGARCRIGAANNHGLASCLAALDEEKRVLLLRKHSLLS